MNQMLRNFAPITFELASMAGAAAAWSNSKHLTFAVDPAD
jgi:hypothetical protein